MAMAAAAAAPRWGVMESHSAIRRPRDPRLRNVAASFASRCREFVGNQIHRRLEH